VPRSLDALHFDLRSARLPPQFFARTAPEPLAEPYLVAFNPAAAPLIDLDPAVATDPAFAATIAGARPLPGADPLAMRYAGHQFGIYVPQLGDGRALLLGEVVGAAGESTELQVKGSGRTPFSRGGDGRAVLRSTIREYLGCEAMHGLGIPTTRALAIVGSDQPVRRERLETAAVLVRLASSHVRFGSFEMFAHIRQPGFVRELCDFVIGTQFPALPAGDHAGLFAEAVTRTAHLVAGWQAVGFTHGVLNTDNMSILGLTLDYGPYAFMEAFDPGFTPNHSDSEGRYAFGRQPAVALWNLGCLAYALRELVPEETARTAMARFAPAYGEALAARFRATLGLLTWRGDEDQDLLDDLLRLLAGPRADYPRFFRLLGDVPAPQARDRLALLLREPTALDPWLERYVDRLERDGRDAAARRADMHRHNPRYVLRTHLAQHAIDRAEQKDFSEIERLLSILRDPFAEQPEHDAYAQPTPGGYAGELSCSS
jgi:uncharacterized protein YdiU (UPF0061 family)